ncbi:S-methylmethionine transporter [Leclercia adecarboxylata]|uniref:S-methylmethionine transporter n=1 Tax=Leclercia adecarboxylata TaxID=83655 RepID=A0A4U9HKQ4_9ENTR|nr:S-methylmethionine transporter [Leclercia adecarboxylata]
MEKSPFVLVFEKVGIPYAADIVNFVILTAIPLGGKLRAVCLGADAVVAVERENPAALLCPG